MNSNDPRDLAHTTREHPGEAIEDSRNWPGYALIGIAIVALGLTLVAAGYGFAGWAWIAGIVCGCALVAGTVLVLTEHQRVKRLDNASLGDQRGH
ncbi:membrane protein [Prescottella defluvii]|uniref:membrane protein n=1 Tax=Prescottella defluvii TaxID=1323361 RepID=UPI0004F3008F|nr:membrane protein [Prescottella defluvii]